MDIYRASSLGTVNGRFAFRDTMDICAIVIHSRFGKDVLKEWLADSWIGADGFYGWYLDRYQHRVEEVSPHYLVGPRGECAELCGPGRVARHIDERRGWHYRIPWGWTITRRGSRGRARHGCQWWWDRGGKDVLSPRDLGGGLVWDGGPNSRSIGIEVVPFMSMGSWEWSEDSRKTLRSLTQHLCDEYSIPFRDQYILSASDVHPIMYTEQNTPNNPRIHQWTGISSMFEDPSDLVSFGPNGKNGVSNVI